MREAKWAAFNEVVEKSTGTMIYITVYWFLFPNKNGEKIL